MARFLSRAAASAIRRLALPASSTSNLSSVIPISSSSVAPRKFHSIVSIKYLFPSIFQSRAFAGGSRRKVFGGDDADDGGEFLEKDLDDAFGEIVDSEDAFLSSEDDDDFDKFSVSEEEED